MRRKLGIQGMDGRSLLEMFTHEEVYPIEGSVVCCLLGVVADHSGIYVGNGRIIHRDGAGFLAEVSQNEFLERLDGWNPAVTVFVSCNGDNPVGSSEIAERAREALNDPRHKGYNLLLKNCHQFCHYCLTGQIDNGVTDFAFTSLEKDLRNILGPTAGGYGGHNVNSIKFFYLLYIKTYDNNIPAILMNKTSIFGESILGEHFPLTAA